MILVLLGTQNNSFHRLLEEIEKLKSKGIIKDKIIVQAGHTKYQSNQMELLDLIPKEELDKYIHESDIVITHGGVGSIISAIKENKKTIAVPRLHKYGEHVNDHQKQIVQMFDKKGYIIGLNDVAELEEAIKKIDIFKPNRYQQNNEKMLNLIRDFINNL